MPSTNSFSAYGSVTKTFHWLTALLIFTALPLGWIANDMAYAIRDPSVPTTEEDIARAAQLFSLHKTVGVTVFFVALARILWAMTQTKPGLLNADNKPEAFAAETVHWMLYASLVLVPLTGWVHHAAAEGYAPILWPFGQTLPFVPKSPYVAEVTANLHWLFIWVLAGSLALHIAGALKHHVIDKDSTLRRMLPGRSDAPKPPAQQHSIAPAFTALTVWGAVLVGGWSIGVFSDHSAAASDTAQLTEVQSDWQVQNGNLAITITQLGSPVTGNFADWTAAITFEDPAAPELAGSVDVTVSITSLSLGTVTDQAMGADFFDSAQFPTAQFKADIYKTATGYEARGPLTIRDKSVDVVLPFTLNLQDNTATMSGELELNRLDFDVGTSQPTEGSLGFDVLVSVNLTAQRGT
ncbi:cytochrome b/b6 domain-containing protein [Ruegeria profundi]|uniref:cytochrome b/b6 domain-containing protein n=1 Tax=Ruegeria profundi TaxID=1685378 RepID=UPI001CD2B9FA|nr:cytochrome b/b6 domain-containing protein [Ruegeria profundi]MCA0927406.1 cytochrome b/b6 domain-containing protein [Ruegeria profundi]